MHDGIIAFCFKPFRFQQIPPVEEDSEGGYGNETGNIKRNGEQFVEGSFEKDIIKEQVGKIGLNDYQSCSNK